MVSVDIARTDDSKIVFIIFFLYSIMFDNIQYLCAKVRKKWQILAFLLGFLYFCIGFTGKVERLTSESYDKKMYL